MIGLYPEFSIMWLAKVFAQPARRVGEALFVPFRTLHTIQWSAPWKVDRSRGEGFG
jgi:hypothetical protein